MSTKFGSCSVFALVSGVAPLASSFEVVEDGELNREASHAKFAEYLASRANLAGSKQEFLQHLVQCVDAIVCSKKKEERTPIGALAQYLANQYTEGLNALTEAPVIADYIAKFIKEHSENSSEKSDHVPASPVLWDMQEKGRGSGIKLHKTRETKLAD